MRRNIFSGLMLLMLLAMAFPPSLNLAAATTTTQNPESWLDADELAYVNSMRAANAAARANLENLRWLIWNAKPFDSNWWEQGKSEGSALSNSMAAFNATAPNNANLQYVSGWYSGVNELYSDSGYWNDPLSPCRGRAYAEAGIPLMDLVVGLETVEARIDYLEGQLDEAMRKLDAAIAATAKAHQQASEFVDSLFSCSERPAPGFNQLNDGGVP
jgi:hypothetical protein